MKKGVRYTQKIIVYWWLADLFINIHILFYLEMDLK